MKGLQMMSAELHVTACSELVCYTRTPMNKKLMGCNGYRDFDCVIYVIVTFDQYLFVFLLYPCELPV